MDAITKSMAYLGARRAVWSLIVGAAASGFVNSPRTRAAADDVVARPAFPVVLPSQPHPRLKVSVNGFSVDNIDTTQIPLTGAHLDAYPLSERWIRGGFAVEGGSGRATAVGNNVNINYGLLGLTAGTQYPGRVTPFVEGHVSGGVLTGRLDGTFNVGNTRVNGGSGTTWMYSRGINIGTEVYVVGRAYVSASVGWIRATWAAPDLVAQVQNPEASLRQVNITSDSLVWRLGLGI